MVQVQYVVVQHPSAFSVTLMANALMPSRRTKKNLKWVVKAARAARTARGPIYNKTTGPSVWLPVYILLPLPFPVPCSLFPGVRCHDNDLLRLATALRSTFPFLISLRQVQHPFFAPAPQHRNTATTATPQHTHSNPVLINFARTFV
jgi:hypothetical protein